MRWHKGASGAKAKNEPSSADTAENKASAGDTEKKDDKI